MKESKLPDQAVPEKSAPAKTFVEAVALDTGALPRGAEETLAGVSDTQTPALDTPGSHRIRRDLSSAASDSDRSDSSSLSGATELRQSSRLFDPSHGRFERYVLLEELGRGGMGVVHAAYDERLGRKVALKFVKKAPDGEGDTQGQSRLLREAKAMAQLAHPNVVTVFDVGKSPDGIFIAMEYVPGEMLQDWLLSEPPQWRILRTFMEAGRGLMAAHQLGIIHRDFKPANVLVSRDGRVKVADFGLAALDETLDAEVSTSPGARELLADDLTKSGARIGTPAYMAPEQHKGEATTAMTDQFAFSVALWEAIFGEHPFPGRSHFAQAQRVTSGKIKPPKNPARASEEIRLTLERGMAVEPSERHRSMGELLHLLEAALTPGVSEQLSHYSGQAEGGVRPGEVLEGRYTLLEPHPVNSLLHVVLDRLSGTFSAMQFARAESDASGAASKLELQLGTEFRALDGVKHPHIVGVKDFGYDGHFGAFLVYDLPRDAVLIGALARRATFDAEVNWLMDIVRAVGFLHERGVAGVKLSLKDVVLQAGRARLLVQLLPHQETASYETRVKQDFSQLSRLSLELFQGRGSNRGEQGMPYENVDLSPRLRAVLRALGSEEGVSSAIALSQELATETGRRLEYETLETREAALLSLQLVGRSRQLKQLKRRLLSAIEARGGLCVVTGESGAGKSRFLQEFRGVTLDSGNRIFFGQSTNEGSLPYEAWREPLRGLVAENEINDFEASVLAWVVPNLSQLLGRRVERAAQLEGSGMRARLAGVVEALLLRRSRAVVIVFEDFQWADADSLTLLDKIRPSLDTSKVLIVATLRSEEAEDVLGQLEVKREVHLEALSEEAVRRLIGPLVSPSLAQRAKVAEESDLPGFVYRHSEGNPLFVVEVLRALADKAGSLRDIQTVELPETLSTGGLRRAVQERLGRLPAGALPLLQVAAIVGRRFHPAVLEAARPDDSIDAWLGLVRTPGIVEQDGATWRFAHDKLREAILQQLSHDQVTRLHRDVAEALERLPEHADSGRLAFHFHQAGDVRAAGYAAEVGEELVHSSPDEAAKQLKMALSLVPLPAASTGVGANGREEIIRWRRRLAEAEFDRGNVAEAAKQIEQVCAESFAPLPRSNFGWWLRLVREFVIQWVHLGRGVARARDAHTERHTDLMLAYDKLAEISFFQSQNLKALTLCLHAQNAGDRAGRVALSSLGILAQTAAILRMKGVARGYFRRGREALERDPGLYHPMFFMMECFAHTGHGRFDEARSSALEGYQLGLSFGHTLGASQCLSALGLMEFTEGRFREMLSRYEAIFQMKNYIPTHDAGPSGGASTAHAMLGDRERALELGERALAGVSGELPAMRAAVQAGQALVRARFGLLREACREADRAMSGFDPTTHPSVLVATLLGPMNAYVSAWREARENEPKLVESLRKSALLQVQHLKKFAGVYPMAKAFWCLGAGQVAVLEGRRRKAQSLFRLGLLLGERVGLTHCCAVLRFELARLVPRGTEERALLLAEAAATFERLGTAPDLGQVRELQAADERVAKSAL